MQMLFEIIVLASVCWNVFDRPRGSHTRLTKVLHRDGITFFMVCCSVTLRGKIVLIHVLNRLLQVCFTSVLACLSRGLIAPSLAVC